MRHHLYRMHEAVLRSAPIRPGDRILYVGCNNAAFTSGMADQLARSGELVAVDFSQATLQRAERIISQSELKNMLFLQLSDATVPFPDRYFDLVITFGAYDHFDDPQRTLEELHRVLKPEGKLYWHDVSSSFEGFWERVLNVLSWGRRPPRSLQAMTVVKDKMSAYFAIEFHRRWTHTWGKQSCLVVGKKLLVAR